MNHRSQVTFVFVYYDRWLFYLGIWAYEIFVTMILIDFFIEL